MATAKQKRVARLIVDNTKLDSPLNGGAMLEKVSYSKGIQIQPSRVLKSKGVKEELKLLGFDENSAKKVVTDILNNGKEENRLRAAQEVFKVEGSYAPEKHETKSVTLTITSKELELAKKYETELNKLEDGKEPTKK